MFWDLDRHLGELCLWPVKYLFFLCTSLNSKACRYQCFKGDKEIDIQFSLCEFRILIFHKHYEQEVVFHYLNIYKIELELKKLAYCFVESNTVNHFKCVFW